MNDCELLDLAAKAAGIDLEENRHRPSGGMRIVDKKSGLDVVWSPLTNDGDALRLATSLQLSILWFTNLQYVMVERRGFGENIGWTEDSGRGSALRRAITCVAAQIGTRFPNPNPTTCMQVSGGRGAHPAELASPSIDR